MRLTTNQRQVLLNSAWNGDVDAAIGQLHGENPEAFHTEATLQQRVFVYEPAQEIPLKAFLRAVPAGKARNNGNRA